MTDTEQRSPLYLKLLAETAQITWPELERFFAKGVLLLVAPNLDLIAVAEAIASDDTAHVAQWTSASLLQPMPSEIATQFAADNPSLWAVVVSPWVCVQARDCQR